MSFDFASKASGLFNEDLITKAVSYLDESESSINKAVSAVVPSLLLGFANKASTHGGAAEILEAAKDSNSRDVLNHLPVFFSIDGGSRLNKGAGIAAAIFGNQFDTLIALIGNFAGIKNSSAASLLSMAAPAFLALLGKYATENNIDAAGLNGFFYTHKGDYAAAMPSGFKAQGIFPVQQKVTTQNKTDNMNYYEENKTTTQGGALKLLIPFFLLALIAALLLYFWKGCNSDNKNGSHTTNDSIVVNTNGSPVKPIDITGNKGKIDSLTGDFMYDEGEMLNIELPNGAGILHAGRYSTEAKLYEFLNDETVKLDTVKGNWFEFTNVHFKSGGTELTDGSMQQLKNLVAIAKAFPKAIFKIGGYTDSTGSLATNMKVSQKRAEAIVALLTKEGINPASIAGAKGYGPEHPIADNKTAEGRAMNRRVAVNVKAK